MGRLWNKLNNARFRRRWLVLFVAAALGGIFTLVTQWAFFRPATVPLPVLVSSSGSPPVHTPAPHELESRIQVNPCSDLHSYICLSTGTHDPTGDVRLDSEGEVEVLRLYEEIIRTHKRLSQKQIDEILVKKIYTPERLKNIRELFAKAKKHLIAFIDSQPFKALSATEKTLLRSRIERVGLELPPPASVYADEPGLFTRNDVFYERTTDGHMRIRLGGALLFTVKSKFNLAFTLTHELAHSIDPCELRAEKVDILAYQELAECFGAPRDTLASECSPHGKISEIFADWVATHIVAEILHENSPSYTPTQIRNAVFNTVRDLCRESNDDDDDDKESGLSSSHPSVSFRVNQIFAQHPTIRKLLACKETMGPILPGIPSFCFW